MRWVRRVFALVTLFLFWFPVALLIGGFPRTQPVWRYLAFGAASAAIAVALEAAFPKRHRPIGIVVFLISAATQAVLLDKGIWNLAFALPVLAFSIASLAAARPLSHTSMTFPQVTSGGALYGIVYVLALVNEQTAILSTLGIGCAVYLIYGIVLLNAESTAVAAGRNSASALRLGNLAMTAGFLLLALLLVNIGAIKELFLSVVRAVILAMLWLGGLFGGGGEAEAVPPGEGPSLGDMGDVPPSWMPQWLETLLMILAWAVTIAVLLTLAFFILRAAARLFKRLYRYLRRWFAAGDGLEGDYDEEQFALMSWKQVRLNAAEGLMRAARRLSYRPPRWEKLNNRQRVRFVMEHMLYRGGKRSPDLALTAREHLAGPAVPRRGDIAAFADAYDRARYSQEPVTDQDAQNAREFL